MMGDLNVLIARMRYWCQTVSLGYSQSDRWGIRPGGNADCSSLVIWCLREAGFDTGAATYTGNLSAELTARGWQRLPNNGSPQAGDILLCDADHVAVYLGNGQLAQASISENGSAYGAGGDQTGGETNISHYYDFPWDCYLRAAGLHVQLSNGEIMAISDDDAKKIAAAVWTYAWPKAPPEGGNMYNMMAQILKRLKAVPADVWTYAWKDGKTGKGAPDGGNMYNALGNLSARVKQLLDRSK
jgi:hypothetical protein